MGLGACRLTPALLLSSAATLSCSPMACANVGQEPRVFSTSDTDRLEMARRSHFSSSMMAEDEAERVEEAAVVAVLSLDMV